ncbi:MAG: ABC transporter substrate-binding protein [Xenococcaceae cyanobacterium MO_188.B32]|nr:ABC transporter substrate-binding protein [Xenococcaceae cyanobacterium MO_188.B32]
MPSILFMLVFLLTILLKGCGLGQSDRLATLKVGMNNWPGYALALYAQKQGLFEQRGLQVQLVHFSNQQDNIRATLREALDASFVPLWEVMQVDPGNDTPAFILVADVSYGSDGIVSQPNIKSIQQLKGKKVGTKLGTVSHLILLEALNAYNLKPENIEITDVLNSTSIHKIKDKELDAAVLWEPSLSETAREINGNIIFTTKYVDSLVIDGLATRKSFVDSHQAELSQFIMAWFDAVDELERNPERVFTVIADELNQTTESFARDYSGLKPGDRAMNQKMFAGQLKSSKQKIIELLEQDPRHSRMIRKDVVFDARPLNDALKNWK